MHLLPAHASPTKQRDEKANETLCYLNSVARADQALKLDALRGKIAVVVVIAHLLEEAFDVAVVDGNDHLRRYRLGELRRCDLGGPGCRNHQRQGLDAPEGGRQGSKRVARIEEAIVDDIGGVLWQCGGRDFLVGYTSRKQLHILKTNCRLVSACHAGRLADNRTPVGSV